MPYALAGSLRAPASTKLEDSIASFNRGDWNTERRDQPFSADHDWIPFYALRSPADYFGWRDLAIDGSDPEHRASTRVVLSDAYRNGLEAFHTYVLPAVIVDRELEPEAIARIFERVNRGGLKLTAFDLMVAKTFESGWNLRQKWVEAREVHPILEEFFADDGMAVIRVIALKARGSVRERDVLGLEGLAVRLDWQDAVEATADALQFLREHCGVLRRDWLPYEGMVITLAAVALDFELTDHTATVRQWFISRGFSLAYDTAANTVTVQQHRQLREALLGEAPLRPMPIASVVLRDATRKRRGALWRIFLAALTMAHARDPLTGQTLEDPRPASLLPRQQQPPPGTESAHLLILALVLAEREHVRSVEGFGVANLLTGLDALPPTVAEDVAQSQLLGRLRSLDLSGEYESEALVEMRLEALDAWLINVLGYGLDSNPHDDAASD